MKLEKIIPCVLVGLFVVLAVFIWSSLGKKETAETLPPEKELLQYVEENLFDLVDGKKLYTEAVLLRPVEIKMAEYSLDLAGKPEIRFIVSFREASVCESIGKDVSNAIVFLTLKWLEDQGYDPYKDGISPSAAVRLPGTAALWAEFGTGYYNYNTDSIIFSPVE